MAESLRRVVGLVLGPLLFAICVLAPPATDPASGSYINPEAPWAPNFALGLLLWIITWWFSEALPFGLTALVAAVATCIAIALDPKAFGYDKVKQGVTSTLEVFFHPLIWVFFGGFVLGYGMQRSGLAKRLSMKIVKIFASTGDFFWIVVGMWAAVWFLSMWMSNTAATAVMYPLLLAVVTSATTLSDKQREFAMIGLAYAASIGGIATLIGTPPNLVATSQLSRYGVAEITFFDWLKWGLPISIVLFVLLLVFGKVIFGRASIDRSLVERRIEELGPLSIEEKLFIATFVVTVSLWILRGLSRVVPALKIFEVIVPHDAVPALIAPLLLFGVPKSLNPYQPVFSWKEGLSKMDWDTLFLFAGGLIVGDALFKTGAGKWISLVLVGRHATPTTVLLVGVVLTWIITQFASNTATTNMMAPLLISIGTTAHFATGTTTSIVVTAAIAASLAFLLPVSTPPNAIVFGSGIVKMERMALYGVLFSAVALPITLVLASVLCGAPLM